MNLSGQRLLLGLSAIVVAMALVIWIEPAAAWLALIVAGCGVAIIVVLFMFGPHQSVNGPPEPEQIDRIGEARQRELIRGTSLHLREMQYRYSVRGAADGSDRRSFTAEVNTVRLGFIPAVITDNTTDRQGYGYVAFVYDGNRWRGPGLPCPEGQEEAVRHAARCVSPLATEEETSF